MSSRLTASSSHLHHLFLAALGLAFPASSQDSAPTGPTESGHARMVRELEEIRLACRGDNRYLGWGRVEELRAQLARYTSGTEQAAAWKTELALGTELLRMGETEEAVASCSRAMEHLTSLARERPRVAETLRSDIADGWFQLGVACLRLGEDRNCCQRSNGESCILPIRGGGLHQDEEGSRRAMAAFRESLALVKANSRTGRQARWLLNLAAMTLGEHPGALTPEELIDASVFASDEDFPRFPEIGTQVGLTRAGLAGGLVVEDFDGDGLLDLLTSSSDADGPLRLYLADGKGSFEGHTEEAGLKGLYGGLNLVSADYDDDGDVDVLVLRGAWLQEHGRHPNSLLRNEGGGVFVDVTFDAGLGSRLPTGTAAFADYDSDGDLDLYVGNESEPNLPAPGELYRNEGDGTFVDVAAEAGVTNDRYAKAVSWGDYDGDGDPDLYISNMASPNRLYQNQGDGTFVDVAPEAKVVAPLSGFPCWFFDFDNDGALDLFAASYGSLEGPPSLADVAGSYLGLNHKGEPMRLYKGDGRGRFTDVAQTAGLDRYTLPMGSNFGDVDNDGYLDVYLGTGYPYYEGLMPNVMLRNRRGAGFADVTTAGGFGHLQKGHGIAIADLDGDGDQDVVARMGGAYPGDAYRCVLFQNPGDGNHWLKVRLVGERSNRFGVGAHLRVDVREGETVRSIHRTVTTGGSFGCNPLRQEIGLGAAQRIETLEVWWPASGTRRIYRDVALDASIEVREGSDEVVVVPVRRVVLGGE